MFPGRRVASPWPAQLLHQALTMAWRRSSLPASYFIYRVSLGWHRYGFIINDAAQP